MRGNALATLNRPAAACVDYLIARRYMDSSPTCRRGLERSGVNMDDLNYMIDYLWMQKYGHCSFLLEYCDQGSLDDLLRIKIKEGELFSERFILHSMEGVGRGLSWLHYGMNHPEAEKAAAVRGWNMTCHLDVKPQNIFRSSRSNHPTYCRIVLGDMGCSVSSNDIASGEAQANLQQFGTPAWYPPEGLVNIVGPGKTHYGTQTDIWEVGATAHTLCRRIFLPERDVLTQSGSGKITGGGYS